MFICNQLTNCTNIATGVENSLVEKIAINDVYGSYVFIKLNKSPERIPCSTNGPWDYTLPLSNEGQKAIFTILIAAKISGMAINIGGSSNPACNEFPHIESVGAIYLIE